MPFNPKSPEARLVLVLLLAAGTWIVSAPHWSDLLTPMSIGGMLVQLVLLVTTAFGIDLKKGE